MPRKRQATHLLDSGDRSLHQLSTFDRQFRSLVASFTSNSHTSINRAICAAKGAFDSKLKGRLNRAGTAHAVVHHLDDDNILGDLLEDARVALQTHFDAGNFTSISNDSISDASEGSVASRGSSSNSRVRSQPPSFPTERQHHTPFGFQEPETYIVRSTAIEAVATVLRGHTAPDAVVTQAKAIILGQAFFTMATMPYPSQQAHASVCAGTQTDGPDEANVEPFGKVRYFTNDFDCREARVDFVPLWLSHRNVKGKINEQQRQELQRLQAELFICVPNVGSGKGKSSGKKGKHKG